MHDSMMMAEVGGIVKVSGSRIATPFAPPRPGSTPMITPSRMPTSIKARLYQDNATLKPPISELISSTLSPLLMTIPVPGLGLLGVQLPAVGDAQIMAYGMPERCARQSPSCGIHFPLSSTNITLI